MTKTLVVAAGGGGDAITASVLASSMPGIDAEAVMSFSWDRLMIDPRPGPRGCADFGGLRNLRGHAVEVLTSSHLLSSGTSTLIPLAEVLPHRLLLLDPIDGAVGLREQIRDAARYFRADSVLLVDVGGDILATGAEPGLRSPTADFLALASCALTDLPTTVIVTGLGLDGELFWDEMISRIDACGARRVGELSATDYGHLRSLFEWHPSEANGFLAAVTRGAHGVVETRDGGGQVTLAPESSAIYTLDSSELITDSLASNLVDTLSLDSVQSIVMEACGRSEIDFEEAKAQRLSGNPAIIPGLATLPNIDAYAAEAAARGVDHLSMRRLIELTGATDEAAATALRKLLAGSRPTRYEPPLYHTHCQPPNE